MIIIKVIHSYRNIVAVCDSNLIGEKFEDEKYQLDVKESFYGKEEFSEEEAIIIMRRMQSEDATFNIVGKDSICAALKAGIINEDGIKEIKRIPFALVLL